jgi:hypothetical protein
LLLTPLLTGCATIRGATSSTTPITASVAAVPCRDLAPVSFAAADSETSADPENEFDTPETIREIRELNAKIRSICPKG